jgi:hypothetical protein
MRSKERRNELMKFARAFVSRRLFVQERRQRRTFGKPSCDVKNPGVIAAFCRIC